MKLLSPFILCTFLINFSLTAQSGFEEPSSLIYSEYELHSNSRYILDDFNGDGNLDIVFKEVPTIYYTNENQELQDSFVIGDYGIFPIAAFDYTGNGLKDIFYFSEWFEAFLDGTYVKHNTSIDGMFQPADFDNDGRTDLLIREIYLIQPNRLKIGWNTGDSDYETESLDFEAYNSSFVKDLNGDNFSDFATLHDSTIVEVYTNQQDSTFEITTINLQTVANDERKYVEIKYGDINNDGIGDIIGIGKGNYLFWLPGTENGEFGDIQHYYLNESIGEEVKIKGFLVRDFNFDWSKDLAVIISNEELTEVYLIYNSENGLSTEPEQIYSEALGYNVSVKENNRILDKDVDADGKVDIVIHISKELIWMKNNNVQTSTKEVFFEKISVSPNPFSTQFSISSEGDSSGGIFLMKISDKAGQTVAEKVISLPYSSEDLIDRSSGIYFVTLFKQGSQEAFLSKKVVKF